MRTKLLQGTVPTVLVFLAACSGGGGGEAAPAFALALQPAGESLSPGGSVQLGLQVTAPAPLQDDVVLTVVAAAGGLDVELSDATVREGATPITVSAAPTIAPAEYEFVVRGASHGTTVDLSVRVTVVDHGYDFAVVLDERTIPVSLGSTGGTVVHVETVRGVPPAVTLSAEGAPPGVSVTIAEGGDLIVEVDAAAPVGTHEIAVVGDANGLRRARTFLLHALPAREVAGIEIDVPPVLQVRRESSTAAQIDIGRLAGVTGDVTLGVGGLPEGVTGGFGQNPATLASTTLQLTAEAGAALGERLLTVTATAGSSRGTSHALLQVVDGGAAADVRVQRVEFAQAFFAPDPGLVGGRETLLRAHVLADAPGVVAPAVRVAGVRNGTPLGSLDLSGPVTLPTGEQPSFLAQSFTATLPPNWVASGLELTLSVDPDGLVVDREERNDRVTIRPTIGSANGIDIVVVPLILGTSESQPGSYEELMLAYWPLAEVRVSVRAPYTVTSVTGVSSDGTGWTTLLAEISALRTSDGSSAYYYGVVPVGYSSGVAGVGYVGYPVSIGWHRSAGVMLHEIGHNFGLRHAPCGGPSGVDPDYPFSGGLIGTWGFDRRTATLVDPATRRDLMSYCSPDWVSGHNFDRVRRRLDPAASIEQLHVGGPMLVVRGVIDGRGARLVGVHRTNGVLREPPSGAELALRLVLPDGRTIEHTVPALEIGCGAPTAEQHFIAAVPDPGPLARLDVVSRGRVLTSLESRREVAGEIALVREHAVRTEERGAVLRLAWDDSRGESVTVVHVGEGRTTLALDLVGGEAEVPLRGVPAGGRFEIGVAWGIDGFTFDVER